MNYNNAEHTSGFDFVDEMWQAGTSSSSSDIYSPSGSMDHYDAMVRWEKSCQNLIPFDYEAWQFEGTFAASDMNDREEQSSAPLSVWEASAQSVGNSIPRSTQQVPENAKTNVTQSPSLSYSQSPSESPAASATKPRYSRKRLSDSALNKRRSQNRESQRSFRERQKHHVIWLEDQVRGLKIKCNELEKEYINLNCKYRELLERTEGSDEAYPSTEDLGSWPLAPGSHTLMERDYISS
ncbi:hypothetical protein ONS95_000263 [Cadophora gregata]|uniref:uncharacterized protein n=1 Tax=Cadophora gregata TaxID=51156 RepID=UPI0026DAB648|nr:uncharacterized protein ONS95_000263 [Cadophora gregata]KAK0099538.1 hypothetical protein ONS96_008372 [Cadophora gregata f. sp. sojae]KAK0112578.1 hypothetical protein ONS96_001813 [Cadophora gregata f. sp. sojae]KAK0125738.1 hypothetical protein ONS96_009569 [Cadophora gregata f. sp. sojae]KAK0128288.1 hypothetical protein ONS95_000263 [Cadophora gregata]